MRRALSVDRERNDEAVAVALAAAELENRRRGGAVIVSRALERLLAQASIQEIEAVNGSARPDP